MDLNKNRSINFLTLIFAALALLSNFDLTRATDVVNDVPDIHGDYVQGLSNMEEENAEESEEDAVEYEIIEETDYFDEYTGNDTTKTQQKVPCDFAVCENNGSCVDLTLGRFQCMCTSPFDGITCQLDRDECLSNPCDNLGTCQNQFDSFNCTCSPAFTGTATA